MGYEKKILILPFLLVVGRVMAPKDVHPLIPQFVNTWQKGLVQMQLRVWTLKVGDYLGRPNLITSF